MTGDRSLFTSYSPCSSNLTVQIAIGSCSKVVGVGTVYVSPTFILKYVLFMPNLDCNLISVHKLNRDLNCETKFVSNSCVFQNLESGKIIGNVEFSAGLYLLKVKDSPINPKYRTLSPQCRSISSVQSVSHSNKDSAVMLWHYRLGHPNFFYLKRLFPSLFINKNPHFFQCDIYQLSKHTQKSLCTKKLKIISTFFSPSWGHLGTIKNSKYHCRTLVFYY